MRRILSRLGWTALLLVCAAAPAAAGEEDEVHPAFDLSVIRPKGFEPRVTGMEALSGGRMALSTWRPNEVWIVKGYDGPADKITAKRAATGFKEIMGLCALGDTLFVADQDSLYMLRDKDGDGLPESRVAIARIPYSGAFHEWSFGLVYKDGRFYTALSAAATSTGKTMAPQKEPLRGTLISIARDGKVDVFATGLRAPNGLCLGPDGDLFATDNQGSWLPASKLIHVRQGRTYGHHTQPPGKFEDGYPAPPAVWLPYGTVTKSPTQPIYMRAGPYAGQFFFGDIAYGVVRRAALEKIDGQWQGCVLRFSGGFEAAVNRLWAGPDGSLYLGGLGNGDMQNWGWRGKTFGLQRLRPNGKPVFEIASVHARKGGFEVVFSAPVDPSTADVSRYQAKQWWYEPTSAYGGPQKDISPAPVRAVALSRDGKRLFLAMDGLRPQQVIHVHLEGIASKQGGLSWTPDFWYTLNAFSRETFQP